MLTTSRHVMVEGRNEAAPDGGLVAMKRPVPEGCMAVVGTQGPGIFDLRQKRKPALFGLSVRIGCVALIRGVPFVARPV